MTQLLEQPRTVTVGKTCQAFTDEHLMEMIHARVRNGLDLLHHRYAGLLKGVSMKMLHNDYDAEDLVQDVFLEIWERATNYDPCKGAPLSWIVTLTRRRSIDRLRKRETYSRFEDRLAGETQGHCDGWTHVHEDLAQSELHEHLQSALACLPEQQRNAIHLAYHGQMTQREIAAYTGIPLGTIKTRLELGIRKMAVRLFAFRDLL